MQRVHRRHVFRDPSREADGEITRKLIQAERQPLPFGPTRSTFMMPVIDQRSAWFMPSRMSATSNQNQWLAKSG
jgi:hypothetical protein